MRTLTTVAVASALLIALAGCTASTPAEDPDEPSTDTSEVAEAPAEEAPAETAPADPTLTDAGPEGSPVMTLSADGFDPASLTISAGDIVEFSTEEGIYGLVIGGLSSVTVTKGLNEYYQFDEPGTYAVSEELSETTATITVE